MPNTIGKWVTTATIYDEPRRELWETIFPGAVVPIESMLTVKVNVPGHEGVEAYMLDIDALILYQLAGVVGLLAEKFGIPAQEVWKDIARGVPILADGVVVSSTELGMLLSLIDDDNNYNLDDEEQPCRWED